VTWKDVAVLSLNGLPYKSLKGLRKTTCLPQKLRNLTCVALIVSDLIGRCSESYGKLWTKYRDVK
jgi:hypothetical protein